MATTATLPSGISIQANLSTSTSNNQAKFPRTGRRGVPQQFGINLFGLLEAESKLLEADSKHPKIISWSDSGKAFRIHDVAEFSLSVLPRYFRTKKFSSFQRNLNLYGFTKLRRGPDMDMYAHPSFMRDSPDMLAYLRKIGGARKQSAPLPLRPVSPTTSTASSAGSSSSRNIMTTSSVVCHFQANSSSESLLSTLPLMATAPRKISGADEQRGCLDLLALAMEYADEHDI